MPGLHEHHQGVERGGVQPRDLHDLLHQDASPVSEERVRHLQTGHAQGHIHRCFAEVREHQGQHLSDGSQVQDLL